MRRTASLALTAVLLTGSATAAHAGDVAAPTPTGTWLRALTAAKQTVTFDAAEGRVSGSAGCNRFTGSYTVSGSRISLGPLGTTMMACPEPVMRAEQTFLARLDAAETFRVSADGSTLTLVGSEGKLTLRAA